MRAKREKEWVMRERVWVRWLMKVEVLVDPKVGLIEVSSLGIPVEELRPWVAQGKSVAEGGGEAHDEGAEG